MKAYICVAAVLALANATIAQGLDSEELMESTAIFYGTEYPIRIEVHAHTSFGDGANTVDQIAAAAKDCGIQAVVVTEHLDCIEVPRDHWMDYLSRSFISNFTTRALGAYRAAIRAAPKEAGQANFIAACRAATVKYGVLIIPGIEVTIGGLTDRAYDPDGSGNYVHLLGVGLATPELCDDLRRYLGVRFEPYGKGEKNLRLDLAQDKVAEMMHTAGLAVIVAHPYLQDKANPGKMYTTYRDYYRYVDGVGFFNGVPDTKSMEAMGMLRPDANIISDNLAPVAEADYHGLALGELKGLNRNVIVGLPEPLTNRSEEFEMECGLVADALRSPSTTIISLAESASMVGDGMVEFWQDAKCVARGEAGNFQLPVGSVDINRAVYVRVPDKMMIRCLPTALVRNVLAANKESDASRNQRFTALVSSLLRREELVRNGIVLDHLMSGLRETRQTAPSGEKSNYDFTGGATIKTTPLGGRR